MPKITINDEVNLFFNCNQRLGNFNSNHNSSRVLFDKIASVNICILALEMTREPALCQLYRRTFVPYTDDTIVMASFHRPLKASLCNADVYRYAAN